MAMKASRAMVAFALLASPASANSVAEPTFQEKVDRADLVVIATTISVDRSDRNGRGPTANLQVVQILKGQAGEQIEVATSSPTAELDPHCCERNATYLMFLKRVGTGPLVSVWGAYGVNRIGGPGGTLHLLKP